MAIKKLQINFTTPEQSKRLLELGVPADSADMFYYTAVAEYPRIRAHSYGHIPNEHSIPCWSVGRLIEIFLKCSPYKDIAINESNIIEQMIESISMVNKDGLLDFSKLEE